ncbi:MAG TPA: MFS transporter [Chloroflexota bacterium]
MSTIDPRAPRATEVVIPPPDGLARPAGLVGKLLRIPTLESLHLREYRLLWLGQGGNSMGMWMDQIARGWLMYELTDSTVQLGFITALRAIPLLLLSPVAGALADRYDRKRQLMVALAFDGTSHAVMAALILSGLIEPWHVYATGAVTSVASVFEQPARQAMVATAVDRRRLTNAIGLDSMVFNVSRSTGPALAGALIALAGTGASYVAQASFYLLAVLMTMQLRPPSPVMLSHSGRAAAPEPGDGVAERHPAGAGHGRSAVASPRPGGGEPKHTAARPAGDAPRPSLVSSTLDGWRYVLTHATVRSAMLVMLLTSLLAAPFTTLLPVFARDILDAGPRGQGLLLSAMGIGALGSAIAIATLGERLARGMLMLAGAFAYGLSVLAFAASGWLALSVALMVVAGAANVACNALVRTVVQGYSPREMGGRVLGALQQGMSLYTIGGLIAGALAAVWGAPWTVGVMAALCTVSALTLFVAIPSARAIR